MNTKKTDVVQTLQQTLAETQSVLLVNFNATSHKTLEDLRKKLYPTGAKIVAVKNTLFEKAVKKNIGKDSHKLIAGFPLKQNTAAVFFKENWDVALKAISEFIKKEESITFKFGLFDGGFFKGNEVKVLANLPSKLQLIGKFAYLFKSPVSRTVFAGKYPMMAMVNVLKAKAAKG
jgi:large subunit ribosomal protein L10